MFNQTARTMSNTENSKKTVRDNDQMTADSLSISEIRKVVTEQLSGYGDVDGMSVMKLVRLLGSAITGRKEEYKLSFNREEEDRWFVDFPNWPWKKGNLEMVCGADKFLDLLSEGKDRVSIIAKATSEKLDEAEFQQLMQDGWHELSQIQSSLTGGATYTVRGNKAEQFMRQHPLTGESMARTLWLCPVTLFVVGRYPKYFYVKAVEE
jgi:hypothetical protein